MLAPYVDSQGVTLADRPSIRFQLIAAPAAPPIVVAAMGKTAASSFALVMEQPPQEAVDAFGLMKIASFDEAAANAPPVMVVLERNKAEPPSLPMRGEIARVWGADGVIHASESARFAQLAWVLGVDLERVESPSHFRIPGSGTWTLLRFQEPDGFLALDVKNGFGEVFPKYGPHSNEFAKKLAHAIA